MNSPDFGFIAGNLLGNFAFGMVCFFAYMFGRGDGQSRRSMHSKLEVGVATQLGVLLLGTVYAAILAHGVNGKHFYDHLIIWQVIVGGLAWPRWEATRETSSSVLHHEVQESPIQ